MPKRPNNGKLSIPLPFDEALKAAMKVPADKLAKPNGKQARKKAKSPPKEGKMPPKRAG